MERNEGLRIVKSEDTKLYYTNFAAVQSALYDFILSFGIIRPAGTDETTTNNAEISVEIAMSPQFAKKLYELLGNNINSYEERFGQIKLPQEQEANQQQ